MINLVMIFVITYITMMNNFNFKVIKIIYLVTKSKQIT